MISLEHERSVNSVKVWKSVRGISLKEAEQWDAEAKEVEETA